MNNLKYQPHPIQLQEITINKLSVVIHDHEKALAYQGGVSMKMGHGKSDFSTDDCTISIGIRVKVEPTTSEISESSENDADAGNPAFVLEVELHGHFLINLEKFQQKHIDLWAKNNAPFLLLPYVREHIYGLANRAGIRGMVLPLFIQPGTENLVKVD